MSGTRRSTSSAYQKKKETYFLYREDPSARRADRIRARAFRERRNEAQELMLKDLRKKRETIDLLKRTIDERDERIETLQEENKNLSCKVDELMGRNEMLESTLLESERVRSVQSISSQFIERILQNKYLMKRLVAFDREEFIELCEITKPHFEGTTSRGNKRQRKYKGVLIQSFEQQMFITLLWLKEYPSDSLMCAIFGLFSWKIADIITHTLKSINLAIGKTIAWPTDSEFEDYREQLAHMVHSTFSSATCVLDGTEIRISRPSSKDMQRSVYSAKKKQHSVNVLIISLLNGKIIYVSPIRQGTSDQAQWNELNLRSRFIGKSYGIIADGGFTFNRVSDAEKIKGWVPHKKRNGILLTDHQRMENKWLSQSRAVIENVIGQLKKWKALGTKYKHIRVGRQCRIDLNDVILACSLLTERRMQRHHQLRDPGWMPKCVQPMSISSSCT